MACEGYRLRPSHGPRFSDSLFLAGKGLLAFRGLSRGDGLLIRLTTRMGERGRDRPCRRGRWLRAANKTGFGAFGWRLARPLLPDGLWARSHRCCHLNGPSEGRSARTSDRAALTGILFVLRSGTPWELLPREMGCGSGMTCWRRLRDWQRAGVWTAFQTRSSQPARPPGTASTSVEPPSTAPRSRAKKGARRQAETDRPGQAGHEAPRPHRREGHPPRPEADGRQRARQPDAGGGRGCRPADPVMLGAATQAALEAARDKAYDHRRCRQALTRRRIRPRIARRGIESSQRLGRRRWVVERTWRGSLSSAASPSATSAAATSIAPSRRWPQPSSSGASSNDGFVRRS